MGIETFNVKITCQLYPTMLAYIVVTSYTKACGVVRSNSPTSWSTFKMSKYRIKSSKVSNVALTNKRKVPHQSSKVSNVVVPGIHDDVSWMSTQCYGEPVLKHQNVGQENLVGVLVVPVLPNKTVRKEATHNSALTSSGSLICLKLVMSFSLRPARNAGPANCTNSPQ